MTTTEIHVDRWQEGGWAPLAVTTFRFPGGEPHAQMAAGRSAVAGLRGAVLRIDARVGSLDDLGRALVVADLLRRLGAAEVHFFCPYLPGARQDRGAPLTAGLFAQWINGAGFDSVVGLDPHSDVMPALLERFAAIGAEEVFPQDRLPGPADAVLVCPDAGAERRVAAVARRFGYEVIHGRKRRDARTGALSGFECEPLPAGMEGIVVDDICDGGGTFVGLADALEVPRERLHLWTTHGIYSGDVSALRRRFATLASTDSFPIRSVPCGVTRLELRGHDAVEGRFAPAAPPALTL